ncbi:MAG: hypothetical protein DMF75_20110, partial [Acidobacteria bacterium]
MRKIAKSILLTGLMVLLSTSLLIGGAQNRQAPAEIPFEFVHNEIVVQVKIAGKGPYSMLIDTDTDPSAIDSATARELGLAQGSKSYPASGGGNDANVFHLTRLPTVELGNVIVKEVSAGTIDLAKLSAKMGMPIHGVLGYS